MRNCDGDPTRTDKVVHPWIHPHLATTTCPVRVLAEPSVMAHAHYWLRWHMLDGKIPPQPGGLDDQAVTDLDLLGLCTQANRDREQFHQDKARRDQETAALRGR